MCKREKKLNIAFLLFATDAFVQDSIGGNCNTLMVAAIWSEANHIEETISTLRYAFLITIDIKLAISG